MGLFTTTVDNSPGALAEELAAAKRVWETQRQSVIDRAHSRIEAIKVTQQELADEQEALSGVVANA